MDRDRHRPIWRTPETYIGVVIVVALVILGIWYAGGFKFFFVTKPIISG